MIAVNPENNLEFGPTCAGSTVSLNLEVFNVGTTNLIINSVQRSAGSTDFTVAPNPTTPVTISPDAHVDFTIQSRRPSWDRKRRRSRSAATIRDRRQPC